MRLTRTLPVVLVLTLAVGARGDAPPDQYFTFSPASLIIIDAHTTLIWLRAPVKKDMASPNSAIAYVGALQLCTNLNAGWRLPSIRELLSIVDEQPHSEHVGGKDVSIFIDANAFPATTPQRFLAASPDPANGVWWVDFSSGAAGVTVSNDQALYSVRCVK